MSAVRAITITSRQPTTVTVNKQSSTTVRVPGIQGPPGSGSGSNLRTALSFAFGDASPLQVFDPPEDCVVISASVVIDTPFNGASPQLQLGTASQPNALQAATDNDPTNTATYETDPDVDLSAGQAVLLTITPGAGATQGAGRIVLDTIAR